MSDPVPTPVLIETPLFTVEDAQRILDAAKAAPLPNMKAAADLAAAIGKFTTFFNVANQAFQIVQATPPPADPPADGSGQAPPASPTVN